MPRRAKCRRVCAVPGNRIFEPEHKGAQKVMITVDELETVRLCDLEGMDQDIAARCMGVSRGTFQRILYAARKSIADALCTGKGIVIAGGNYELAEGGCGCTGRTCAGCPFAPAAQRDVSVQAIEERVDLK